MYVTGGIGSSSQGERFAFDFDLPNETAYAETCAAIGLVFWNHRMLQITGDSKYADVMERALYNGVLSGVSLDGKKFFYVNPLASLGNHHRQEWFGCACCPPNIARVIAGLGQYIYSKGNREIFVHLYIQSELDAEINRVKVRLVQKTGYPWQDTVNITVFPERETKFTLALRIPGWCRNPKLMLNGKPLSFSNVTVKGYVRIARKWSKNDRVTLTLPMPVELIKANPAVRTDCGKAAIQRGPIVYCLEEIDNGKNLANIALPRNVKLKAKYMSGLLGGVVAITCQAKMADRANWHNRLYQPDAEKLKFRKILAVPYYAWDNRRSGEMLVWVPA
jgi:DUF1680 family protein